MSTRSYRPKFIPLIRENIMRASRPEKCRNLLLLKRRRKARRNVLVRTGRAMRSPLPLVPMATRRGLTITRLNTKTRMSPITRFVRLLSRTKATRRNLRWRLIVVSTSSVRLILLIRCKIRTAPNPTLIPKVRKTQVVISWRIR